MKGANKGRKPAKKPKGYIKGKGKKDKTDY
jgi:hypothetical protein